MVVVTLLLPCLLGRYQVKSYSASVSVSVSFNPHERDNEWDRGIDTRRQDIVNKKLEGSHYRGKNQRPALFLTRVASSPDSAPALEGLSLGGRSGSRDTIGNLSYYYFSLSIFILFMFWILLTEGKIWD